MAKEKPRYKVITEYERELKKEYGRTMANMLDKIFKKIKTFKTT